MNDTLSAIAPTPGHTTDMPCPVCRHPLSACRPGTRHSFPWCPDCGWNLRGASRALRGSNLDHFLLALPWLTVLVPIAYASRGLGPVLAQALDAACLVALFVPAVLRSQGNLDLARQLDSQEPRRTHVVPPASEAHLPTDAPREVRLSGSPVTVRPLMALLRVLGTTLFASGLVVLTPLAGLFQTRLRGGALLVMLGALIPFLGAIGVLLLTIARHRHLAQKGVERPAEVTSHTSLLRRVAHREWTLRSQVHYRFTAPDGTVLTGRARIEGTPFWSGAVMPVWLDPGNPAHHMPVAACLYGPVHEASVAGYDAGS